MSTPELSAAGLSSAITEDLYKASCVKTPVRKSWCGGPYDGAGGCPGGAPLPWLANPEKPRAGSGELLRLGWLSAAFGPVVLTW